MSAIPAHVLKWHGLCVCLCVCVLVTTVSPTKTAEIQMPFVEQTCMGPPKELCILLGCTLMHVVNPIE